MEEGKEWPKYASQRQDYEDTIRPEQFTIDYERGIAERPDSEEEDTSRKRVRAGLDHTTSGSEAAAATARPGTRHEISSDKESQRQMDGATEEAREVNKRKRDDDGAEERAVIRRICAFIDGEYYDDTSGKLLDKRRAIEARAKEIEYFRKMQVYTKVPIDECWQKTGKAPIRTGWVEINKGDERVPNYRARLVGKEIKRDKREDLFAATPPLESLRFLLSDAVTGWNRKNIMFIDVSRAYFYAKARRDVYIVIPREDWEAGDEWRCGKLNLSMYGTRDAAQNWEECYQNAFKEMGFKPGLASVCHLHNRERDLKEVVHGDDFTVTGSKQELTQLAGELGKRFEIKLKIMGPERDQVQEQIILNRIVRWTNEGLQYEADPRHAELVVRQMQQKREYRTPIDKQKNQELARATSRPMGSSDASR